MSQWDISKKVDHTQSPRKLNMSMIHPDPYPDETVEEIIASARRAQERGKYEAQAE